MASVSDIRFLTPSSLREALLMLETERGAVRILAGGTDAMVWQQGGNVPLPQAYLSIWGLDELRRITRTSRGLEIGALATFSALRRSPDLVEVCPALLEAARQVGAVQIQNRATLGGNVVNASPAGDSLPCLLVHGATVVLESASRGERRVPFEAFYRGYRLTALAPDELLTRVEIPYKAEGSFGGFEKVGSRRAQTISKVMAALRVTRDAQGRMHEVALAYGSVAPTVLRIPRTEQALEGQEPTPGLADAVAPILLKEISPISDLRSNVEYRKFAAVGLLRRLLRRCSLAPFGV